MNDTTVFCEAITRLARTGGTFTADDLRFARPDLDSRCLGRAFRICSQNKVIRIVGFVNSKTEGRNGNTIKQWSGY